MILVWAIKKSTSLTYYWFACPNYLSPSNLCRGKLPVGHFDWWLVICIAVIALHFLTDLSVKTHLKSNLSHNRTALYTSHSMYMLIWYTWRHKWIIGMKFCSCGSGHGCLCFPLPVGFFFHLLFWPKMLCFSCRSLFKQRYIIKGQSVAFIQKQRWHLTKYFFSVFVCRLLDPELFVMIFSSAHRDSVQQWA